jgi:hypothetical protein
MPKSQRSRLHIVVTGLKQNSQSGIEPSPHRRARCAGTSPAVPLGTREGYDIGGKDERFWQHRIGHFRFQACGECDTGIRFASLLISLDIRVGGACWHNGGQADLES